jgi:hypothetical protein
MFSLPPWALDVFCSKWNMTSSSASVTSNTNCKIYWTYKIKRQKKTYIKLSCKKKRHCIWCKKVLIKKTTRLNKIMCLLLVYTIFCIGIIKKLVATVNKSSNMDRFY